MKAQIKSGVLTGLVLGSVCLSYVLWHGDWQNSTEVAYTDGAALPATQTPRTSDVSKPFEIAFMSVKPNQYAVGLPDSTLYRTWTQKLGNAHFSGLQVVQVLPKFSTTASVRFDFGTEVAYRDLTRWLPGMPLTALVKSVNTLVLYETADKKSVQLAIVSGDGNYIADTDISVAQFPKDVTSVTTSQPWVVWSTDANGMVPKDGLSLAQYRYKTSQPQILPLVHSFFVNPQALSRIQEDKTTVLFTDGSRVVWWDQSAETLTFADPNHNQSPSVLTEDLSTALQFIRNHGGSPTNVFAFRTDGFNKATTYTLQTYIHGLPVFGSLGAYKTEMEDGKVVQYQRPLQDFGQQVDVTAEQTFGASQLAAILHQLMPTTPSSGLTVQLGYEAQTVAMDTVILKPVYSVSQNGTTLWTIDANSGKVEKGLRVE